MIRQSGLPDLQRHGNCLQRPGDLGRPFLPPPGSSVEGTAGDGPVGGCSKSGMRQQSFPEIPHDVARRFYRNE